VSDDAQGGRGITTRVVEIVSAVGILALGALVVFDSLRLGSKWADDGPQAGYFPFYVGSILCICALVLLAHALVGKFAGPRVFASGLQLRRVMQVFVPAAIYVAAIQLIGIYVASACYIAFFMRWLGKYALASSALLGVGLMAAFFLMFEVWFKVPLYKGLWNPLFWLGY
jgi:hypothetical protein